MTRLAGLGATVTMATLLVVVGCGDGDGSIATTLGGGEPESGTLVEGEAYRGVLLDAHLDYLQPADGDMVEDVDSFVPTPDDVERFEAQLPDAFDTAGNPGGDDDVAVDDLDGYVRQYTGVAAAGSGRDDRHLVVAAICDSAAENGIEWQRGWVEVADGGTCFWDATMDLGSGEILRFGFHGSA